MKSKWSDPGKAAEVVWVMRTAEAVRSSDRDILNRTYNGDAPFDQSTAEENNIDVNRNFLEGTGLLTDARTQWNNNFLKPGNVVTVQLDSGPAHKKAEWSQIITRNLNRELKRSPAYITQARETGAGVLLHGIGPTYWQDRRTPIPKNLAIASLLIPSDTDIDFSNLEYFAIFRRATPTQLWDMTHGPKVDPGWNIKLVENEYNFIVEQTQQMMSTSSLVWMQESGTEMVKQDGGFWGSDSVPKIDFWDFYYREREGDCWYRKSLLDWGSGGREVSMNTGSNAPDYVGKGDNDKPQWLYDCGKRKYASSWSEIVHCNFGDCSCVAPFKYHSVRSLGWMNWGIVDINNRMLSKMSEQAFSDLMWFFRVANGNDMNRLKKANFLQMGVIPPGIDFIKGNERFNPNPLFLDMVLEKNRQLLSSNSSSFTRNAERSDSRNKEKTATQVMAEVNSINTMVSGVMGLAKTYEGFKDREIGRRYCIPNNPDASVKRFRKACILEGVPAEMLEIERWDMDHEMAMGAGNKTVQMAIVQYLQSIRQNLGPEAQRKVDHDGILIVTEDAQMAEDLAPISGQQSIGKSTHDAELATDRLMLGLPFTPTPQMVYEDYIIVWLRDMSLIVKQIQETDNIGTQEQIIGLQNMASHISAFMQIMAQSDEGAQKARQYSNLLGQLMNVVKGFMQRLTEKAQAENGSEMNGELAKVQSQIQKDKMIADAKTQATQEKAALQQAQKQSAFELQQQREDRKTEADIRRINTVTAVETAASIRSKGAEALAAETNGDL